MISVNQPVSDKRIFSLRFHVYNMVEPKLGKLKFLYPQSPVKPGFRQP